MLWNKVSLKSSLHSLLGAKPGKPRPNHTHQLAQIRTAMLDCLQAARLTGFDHVELRLQQAKDVEGLWYLRADLMAALASTAGEAAARRAMAQITPMFSGLLPPSLNSRASPLGD